MGCTPAQTYIYGMGSAKPRPNRLPRHHYRFPHPHPNRPPISTQGIHMGHTPVHRFEPDRIDFKQDGLGTKSQLAAATLKKQRW